MGELKKSFRQCGNLIQSYDSVPHIDNIPVEPHEAVPEVSKIYLYINQKKKVPIEIVGEHFAFRISHFAKFHFAQSFVLKCHLSELLLDTTAIELLLY